MLMLFVALLAIAFFFFGLIPGIGAFLIRGQWHRFRQQLIQASRHRIADFSIRETGAKSEALGLFRFFGRLESIQGKNRLWITNDTISVGIDMEQTTLYLLRSFPLEAGMTKDNFGEEILSDEEPEYLPWKKIYSLPSGIQVFVSGQVYDEAGQLIFRGKDKHSPLIIIFDGPRDTLLKRCIWSGRQKNEYINQFTTVSLILGSLLLLLISFLFIQNEFLLVHALFALTLSTFPVVYLLPPGVLLYFLYRYFWKRSRLLRSERDLLLLPLRYFPPGEKLEGSLIETTLPNGEHYVGMEWRRGERDGDMNIPRELKFRGSSLSPKTGEENPYYLFGVKSKHEMVRSNDPMVELLCIPGNPEKLSAECDRKAKELGIVSAICIFSGLLLNFGIVFAILLTILQNQS